MSQFPSQKEVERIKKMYPKGTRIQIERMDDPYHPIERGTKGTVDHVDDAGTLHCTFDNGRSLGVVPDADIFHVIDRMNVSIAERYACLLGSAIDGNKRLHNVQEVAEFICKHGQYSDVRITTMEGKELLDTFGIYINKISDMEYREELLKVLIPMLNYMTYLFYGEKVLDTFERNKKFFTDKQRDEFRTGVYSPHLEYDKYKVIVHKPDFQKPYYIGIAAHIFLDSLYESEFLVKHVDFINEQGTPAKSQNDAKLVHIKKSDEFVPVEEFFSIKYLHGDFSRMTMYIIQKYYMKPVIYAETINKIKEQQASCIDAALETYIRKAAIPETDMSVFEKDNFCSFIFECAERFVELYAEDIILKPSCYRRMQ